VSVLVRVRVAWWTAAWRLAPARARLRTFLNHVCGPETENGAW
jgi:hypothetical protein